MSRTVADHCPALAVRVVARPMQLRGIGDEDLAALADDNPAPLAVSRKVGYRPDGLRRLQRRDGELAVNPRPVLRPDDLVRGHHPITVEGAPALRRLLVLDAPVKETA